MNRRSIFIIASLLAVSSLFTGCASTPDREKVVFHLSDNDPGKWNLTLNNVENVQDAFGGPDKVDVEVVVYGPGINMLKAESTAGNRVNAAAKRNVQIVACETTMRKAKLTKADMNPNIGYVPGGVIELMARQKQGWAYVRP